MRKIGYERVKKHEKSVYRRKKVTKNSIDNQCSYKKLCEKDEKKFGRIKKVRTFALANEARDTHLARNCESYLKLQKPKVACL